MAIETIIVESYFDGLHHHNRGPYTISLQEGVIDSIRHGDCSAGPDPTVPKRAAFAMPGMVEAHSHLFLDGGELNFAKRSAYLSAPREDMMAVGRRALAQSFAAGVTLVRDAGDIHGINLALRGEGAAGLPWPAIRASGAAIRKAGRYGSFIAREVTEAASIEEIIAEVGATADDIKILMTGIIDFEAGVVKGAPQFTLEEARRIKQSAAAFGRRTFAHCSGADGIDIALEAGFDSIEHGFFINREQLRIMADRQISWVPTFSPVHFQWARPDLAGLNANTVGKLHAILDAHREQLGYAYRIGVPVLTGSDAGSYGVRHGASYIEELMLMAGAGIPLELLLHSATALPRRLWGCAARDIAPGCTAEMVMLERSPFDDLRALEHIVAIYHCRWHKPAGQVGQAGHALSGQRHDMLDEPPVPVPCRTIETCSEKEKLP